MQAITIIQVILWLIAAYLGCGIVFSIAFLRKGIQLIDENARHSSIGFRLIILPGIIALWPFLLKKWLGRTSIKKRQL